jgi:hypothetical protein
MAMFDFLARLLGRSTRSSPTRLSSDEAIAVARRAAAGDPQCENLVLAKVETRSGNATWIISSATVGNMLEVAIDDATGKVLEMKNIGTR